MWRDGEFRGRMSREYVLEATVTRHGFSVAGEREARHKKEKKEEGDSWTEVLKEVVTNIVSDWR